MPAVLYEKKGHVACITLNRPEAYNAINSEAWEGLTNAWISVRDDNEVRVAIVTGAGDKAFCSGADLKEIAANMMLPPDKRPRNMVPDITPMRGLEVWKPFIAAVKGIATGGGLELAMACDIIIVADNARLGLMEVKQGVMPGMSGTQRLPRLVGQGKALELILTAEPIDAREALLTGLIAKIVPPDSLLQEIDIWASKLSEYAPIAMRYAKEAVTKGMDLTLDQGLRLEADLYFLIQTTGDRMEGIKAFLEKRSPNFKGK